MLPFRQVDVFSAEPWRIGAGALPSAYTARQGCVIGRDGRVRIEADAGQVWVYGDAVTRIVGEVDL